MASGSTLSANEPANDIILVHIVQLKPIIKAYFSGRMVSSGISDVVIASVYSEKIRLKKLMKSRSSIGERAKRARRSQVCSMENRNTYIYIRMS